MSLLLTFGKKSVIQRAISVLRKFGTNAHAYIPGWSISTYGPELAVAPTSYGSSSVSSDETGVTVTATTNGTYGVSLSGIVSNTKTYLYSVTLLTNSASKILYIFPSASSGATATGASLGDRQCTAMPTGASAGVLFAITGGVTGESFKITNISVKEVITTNSVVLNGLTAGNYTDTAGTQLTTKDQPVGLDLDAMGSLGAELVTNGGFDTDTGWTKNSGWTISGGKANATTTSNDQLFTALSISPGKTYLVTFDVISYTSGTPWVWLGQGVSTPFSTTPGAKRYYLAAGSGDTLIRFGAAFGVGWTGSIDNISVKEITGIHATQGTAGNKPVLRQGPVNAVTYSDSYSGTGWSAVDANTTSVLGVADVHDGFATCSEVTGVSGTCGYSGSAANRLLVTGLTYTCSAWVKSVSGNTNIKFVIGATQSAAIPIAESWVRISATISAGNTVPAIYLQGPGVFRICGVQFELGSAATIYIPTTSAKASAGTGLSYWEFGGDGTPTDYLGLGSVPFQMSDDHCVVVAASVNSLAAGSKPIFSNYGTTTRRVAQLSVEANTLTAKWVDDAGTAGTSPTGSVVAALTPFVATARKVGNVKELRKNSVLINSSSTAAGTTTLTASAIGYDGASYFNGSEHAVFVIKGTITDADLLLVEKLAASLAGITI